MDDPQNRSRVEREISILGLQREAAEAARGKMWHGQVEDAPLEVTEQFWRQVVAYEKAPNTTHLEQLARLGITVTPPHELMDDRLPAALEELVAGLARLRVFLYSTDHLSARELYTRLWDEPLRDPVKDIPMDEHSAWNIDFVSTGSEEDTSAYLKYYASEASRASWQRDFPDYAMPPHEDPPFDRDRHLPQRTFRSFADPVDK